MAPLSVTRKRETSCTSLTGVFPHLLGQLPTKDVTVQPVPPGGDSYKQLLISLASWKVGFLGQQVPSGTQVGLGKGSQAVGSCVTSISPLWPLWSSCWHWVSGDGLMPIGEVVSPTWLLQASSMVGALWWVLHVILGSSH